MNENVLLEKKIRKLDKSALVTLLADEAGQDRLFQQADKVRQQNVGDEVHLRGLIEFSNICRNNCCYCGIRRGNAKVCRYHMTADELFETARKAVEMGFKTVVMQSGEDMYYTADLLCRVIEKIKKYDVAVTLSIGERPYSDYKAFREAGADRYLMRIETTDKVLFHQLKPGNSWQYRYECLLALKELGYEVGSGSMVGLPGQSLASMADDLLFLQELGVAMAGIGPFIPHPETPLKDTSGGSLFLALRMMAALRLLMPSINIPATTAMEVLHPRGRLMALQSGANVVMPNVTEVDYRKFYELYPGKVCLNDTPKHFRSSIGMKIVEIGRKPL